MTVPLRILRKRMRTDRAVGRTRHGYALPPVRPPDRPTAHPRKEATMRGKILQYNGNDGTGILVADGQQHRFTLASWKGDHAPAVGKTVEAQMADGQVQSVALVGDDILLREKAEELGGKLGGLVGGLGGTLAKGGAGGSGVSLGGSIVERFGAVTLAAYAVFQIGTTMFKAVSNSLIGSDFSMCQPASSRSAGRGGAGTTQLLVLSCAATPAPDLGRDRRACLALLSPLQTMVCAVS